MYGSGISKYKSVTITTASRGQLLVALYEAAIRYSKQAAASIESGNVVSKGTEIQRVSSIVAELTTTTKPLVEVTGLLESLLAAWVKAIDTADDSYENTGEPGMRSAWVAS